MFYAHTTPNPDKSDWQFLRVHLNNVAKISSEFADVFKASEFAYAGGLLHDLGKYSPEFQKRLEGVNIPVDHATAGAREAIKKYHASYSRMLAYVITGHHGGLLNYGSPESGLEKRMAKSVLPDYSSYRNEITLPDQSSFRLALKPFPKQTGFCFSFFTRMVYSCLVDADSLDTEEFMSPEKSSVRGQYESFEILKQRFEEHMCTRISGAEDNRINKYRREIYDQCVEKAVLPPGMFSLTVPTGGGKTLASMGFALEHLKKNDLKRIFYVIPYTSIIEQNADVFRNIFGSRNVLEHHSNFDPDKVDTGDMDSGEEALRLSTENWEMPVVITTNVQFFESLFSNKRSRCRKLHNLAKSVIILDEAQMLPTGYLKPCLAALSELVRNYGSTVVICTATQPNLDELFDDLVKPVEIMKSPAELYDAFRRVNVTDLGSVSDDVLSERLRQHHQVLCIVNTRNHAKKLFDELEKSGHCYHLSARMCPVHRREQIAEIKHLLKEGGGCRVISTQLIEAGVDIDFPVVYRAMTGIDSIAQAAGRCNREGKVASGEVYIFKSTELWGKATHWQSLVAEVGEMVLANSTDALAPSTVSDYFRQLYHYKGDDGLDTKKILQSLEKRSRELAFPFEDIGSSFSIIEEGTKDLIIPYDEKAASNIQDLRNSNFPWRFVRQLQGYTVNIYPNEFRELERLHAIDLVGDRFYILKSRDDYSDKTGLLNRKNNGANGSLLIV
ncbi:CRISPR-associated helicase Cas3' [Methanoregula sp.]|jgi:CRISPR-associated endonuclease/helicase Cas3/CRISPR-associated endonuclease Cas3-HD|uniref:CRISPR-associated helicase Cas3' n=1 Tax=Methanoregula sp. TaxID=2052170 RepID=UPI003C1F7F94